MKRPPGRRAALLAAAVAAIAVVSGPFAAHATDIRGAVTFEGGAVIPEGYVEVYLDDPAIQEKGQRRAVTTRIKSDGRSKAIAFSLSPLASSSVSPALRIFARLERADGWLLARGSARFELGSPVDITLTTVMY